MSEEQILADYPELDKEDFRAVDDYTKNPAEELLAAKILTRRVKHE